MAFKPSKRTPDAHCTGANRKRPNDSAATYLHLDFLKYSLMHHADSDGLFRRCTLDCRVTLLETVAKWGCSDDNHHLLPR